MNVKAEKNQILLVYDKECPLCDNYCRMVRIREDIGELVLVNARENSEVMAQITQMGLDIDQGMVLQMNGNIFYGSDAIHALAMISSRSTFFNRVNYWMFNSKKLSMILYPLCRFFRNLLLKVLGVKKINNLALKSNQKF
ncbi:DUF393 domain-containing protein [Aliikangiella marina]|uniref:DUF393 domain-containing protein n=1 Tax=Aliikangiella marina TaxID=1712262 RepID=A0A545T5E3_9GAMM|nr:DCC1-like thiol-disulfide oxidoreductase family protein [Aliikangiella marina]TQV72423.1 DUF393 domain-containing protein [Aliikangiella marina]